MFIANDIAELFDLVILAVKAYALDQALADLAPAVGAGTMIMPLLNRMRHIDLLIQRFGEAPVLGGADLASKFLDKAASVAAASDFSPGAPFMARARAMMTARGSGFASSMYRDMQGNAPVEVEHILGDMLRRASGMDLRTPLLEAAVAQCRFIRNGF